MEQMEKTYGGQPQYICLENKDILQDCLSSSRVCVGNFTSKKKAFINLDNKNSIEAVFLRG